MTRRPYLRHERGAVHESNWPTLDEQEAVFGSRALSLIDVLRGEGCYEGLAALYRPPPDPRPRPAPVRRPQVTRPRREVAQAPLPVRLMFAVTAGDRTLVYSACYGESVAAVWPARREFKVRLTDFMVSGETRPPRFWIEHTLAPAWPRRAEVT